MHLFSKNVDCNFIKRRLHRRFFLKIFGKFFTSDFIFYFYYFFYYVYYFFMFLSPIFISFVLLFWYVHLHYFKFHYNDCFQTGICFSYLRSEIHTLLLWLIIFHTPPFLTKKCVSVIGFLYSLKWYLNWQVVNDWLTNLWAEEIIATYPLLPAITFYKIVIRFVC